MLLGSTKAEIEAWFGKSVMAHSLLDMTARGEKTFSYSQSGNEIIVGFFNNIARYMAVIRRSGPLVPFSSVELASILSLNASPSSWKKEVQDIAPSSPSKTSKASKRIQPSKASVYFSYTDKNAKEGIEILGWQPANKSFIFFFIPTWPNQLPILLNEWQILKAIN